MTTQKDRIEAAIRHIQTAADVDPWAMELAVEALKAQLPSAQPEKVKCKKCRYVYYDKEFGNYWCNRKPDSFMVEEDGYCKWGK